MTTIAITGPGGRIGDHLLPAVAANDVVTIDKQPLDLDAQSNVTEYQLDITDGGEQLRDALIGCDVVLHLAAESSSNASWEEVVEPNIVGLTKLYETAVDADVRRIVFASSNHASHLVNIADPHQANSMTASPVAVDADYVAPTGPYGVTKLMGEGMGQYLVKRHRIEIVNLRIGAFRTVEQLQESQTLPEAQARYFRSMFLSPRDGIHAMKRAIEAELPVNPLTVNVTSRNAERTMSITRTMRTLGYEPQDAAEDVLS